MERCSTVILKYLLKTTIVMRCFFSDSIINDSTDKGQTIKACPVCKYQSHIGLLALCLHLVFNYWLLTGQLNNFTAGFFNLLAGRLAEPMR